MRWGEGAAGLRDLLSEGISYCGDEGSAHILLVKADHPFFSKVLAHLAEE